MRNSGFIWIIILILLVLDIYVYQALKVVTQGSGQRTRMIIFSSYWLISAMAILFLVTMPYLKPESWPKGVRTYVFAIVVGLFFAKLLSVIFLVVDDVRRGMMWTVEKFFSNPSVRVSSESEGITRSTFLSWMGLTVGGSLLGTLLYGFTNKYNYRVHKVKIHFKNLPEAFRGFRILHISDIHSGSFTDPAAVQKGIDRILQQKADIILFTGDLVNDRATEMDQYHQHFAMLKAPMGVYSTLGNHDYGDYVQWESDEAKKANLEALKKVHANMGWRLLMNEHVVLERDGQQIALLGIENWGAKGNFPKYGRLKDAHTGTENYPFKILMSHDPSHWDAEVVPQYQDVDLMLAGHTHGMQFGVEIPGFRWSPVQYMYKQWAGLYARGNQHLYVNRGFGFLGYPGRVGILPEISVIELV